VIAEAVDGGTLNLNVGASQLQGTLRADATSQLHAKLSNGAVLTGVMTNVTSTTLDTATWNMTGNSTIGALSLGNGTVSLGDGSAFHTLNVAGNFSGADGTIVFNTVLAGDAATDKLIIGGDTSGTANVRVNNVGGAGAQTDKGIELISVGGASNGQFNLAGRAVVASTSTSCTKAPAPTATGTCARSCRPSRTRAWSIRACPSAIRSIRSRCCAPSPAPTWPTCRRRRPCSGWVTTIAMPARTPPPRLGPRGWLA
jgi:hypothetical protein